MSVKELKLGDLIVKYDHVPMTDDLRIWLKIDKLGVLSLDSNQAYLLMLYLQEHLK